MVSRLTELNGREIGTAFQTTVGVLQGCRLLPTLFIQSLSRKQRAIILYPRIIYQHNRVDRRLGFANDIDNHIRKHSTGATWSTEKSNVMEGSWHDVKVMI